MITTGKTGDVITFGNASGNLFGKLFGSTARFAAELHRSNMRTRLHGTNEPDGRNEPDRIEIIWPDVRDPDTDDENKNSLIFKVYINGITVLITGDLGEEGEHDLVERYRGTGVLDCDVLKVCHHGSKYSSSAEFLEAVSPKVALIGVGKNNPLLAKEYDIVSK